jgi:hypothetical protein
MNTNQQTIKPGDIVRLKSNSLNMTVASINKRGVATVVYSQYHTNMVQKITIPIVALVKQHV